jgi:hypothetical protein
MAELSEKLKALMGPKWVAWFNSLPSNTRAASAAEPHAAAHTTDPDLGFDKVKPGNLADKLQPSRPGPAPARPLLPAAPPPPSLSDAVTKHWKETGK